MLDQIALVDMEVDLNTISFDTWEELGRPKLVDTKLDFSKLLWGIKSSQRIFSIASFS